ncbi:hypothetical protein ES703_39089 [subsurface metagenome]
MGQGVEAPVMQAAGHQVVPRSFRSGLHHEGGLHLHEVALGEIVTYQFVYPAAGQQVALQLTGAQLQVAVGEALLLGGAVPVGYQKRQRLGLVEDLQLQAPNVDLASGHIGIETIRRSGHHLPPHGDHVFHAQPLGGVEAFRCLLPVEDHLGLAVAVAQVDEDQPAVVPP